MEFGTPVSQAENSTWVPDCGQSTIFEPIIQGVYIDPDCPQTENSAVPINLCSGVEELPCKVETHPKKPLTMVGIFPITASKDGTAPHKPRPRVVSEAEITVISQPQNSVDGSCHTIDEVSSLDEKWLTYTVWLIYIVITILNILFASSSGFGIMTPFYKSLKKGGLNAWFITGLWIVAIILSYVTIYLLLRKSNRETRYLQVRLAALFLITAFLNVAWAVAYFQGRSVQAAVWITGILFIYQFWLLIYILYIDFVASLFMIPLVILYGYQFYSLIHIAGLNDIVV